MFAIGQKAGVPMPDAPEVLVIDYGLGNLFNVQRAIESVGGRAKISANPEDLQSAERAILPGVGAFIEGMKGLESRGFIAPIQRFAASGKPFMGICLGMQLLMLESEEMGSCKGLGLIKGRVQRFQEPEGAEHSFKIPNIGWGQLLPATKNAQQWAGSILEGLDKDPYLYFLHSYFIVPQDISDCLAFTEYGRDRFCSAVRKKNISGCQPHPERSGPSGQTVFRNFLQQKAL